MPVTLAWFRPALTLVALVAFLFGALAVKRFRGQRPRSRRQAPGSEPRQDPHRRERAGRRGG